MFVCNDVFAQKLDTIVLFSNDSSKKYLQLKLGHRLMRTECYDEVNNIVFVDSVGYASDGSPQHDYIGYYNDGKIKYKRSLYGVQGLLDGPYLEFYRNGNMKRYRNYILGKLEGDYSEYYENGVDSIKATFKSNVLIGKFQSYYKTGQLASMGGYYNQKESMYNDTVLVGDSYEILEIINWGFGKDKDWKYYSENGDLVKEEMWDKGELVSRKEY